MWVTVARLVLQIASYFWDVAIDVLVAREQIPQTFPNDTVPDGGDSKLGYVLSQSVWLSSPPNYDAIHLFLTWLWIVSGGTAQFFLLAWHLLWRRRARVIPLPWLVAALLGSAAMLGPSLIYFFCLFTLLQNWRRPDSMTDVITSATALAATAKLAEIFAESLPQFCTQLLMTSAKGQGGVRSLSFAQMISVCSSAVTLSLGLADFVVGGGASVGGDGDSDGDSDGDGDGDDDRDGEIYEEEGEVLSSKTGLEDVEMNPVVSIVAALAVVKFSKKKGNTDKSKDDERRRDDETVGIDENDNDKYENPKLSENIKEDNPDRKKKADDGTDESDVNKDNGELEKDKQDGKEDKYDGDEKKAKADGSEVEGEVVKEETDGREKETKSGKEETEGKVDGNEETDDVKDGKEDGNNETDDIKDVKDDGKEKTDDGKDGGNEKTDDVKNGKVDGNEETDDVKNGKEKTDDGKKETADGKENGKEGTADEKEEMADGKEETTGEKKENSDVAKDEEDLNKSENCERNNHDSVNDNKEVTRPDPTERLPRFVSASRPPWTTKLVVVLFLITEIVVIGGICRFSFALSLPAPNQRLQLPSVAIIALPPAFFVTLAMLVELVHYKSLFPGWAHVVFLSAKILIIFLIVSLFIVDASAVHRVRIASDVLQSLSNNNSLLTFFATLVFSILNSVLSFSILKHESDCPLFVFVWNLWEKRPFDIVRRGGEDVENETEEDAGKEKEMDKDIEGNHELDSDKTLPATKSSKANNVKQLIARIFLRCRAADNPDKAEDPSVASPLWLLLVFPIIVLCLFKIFTTRVVDPNPDYSIEFHSDCHPNVGFPVVAKSATSPRGAICVVDKNVTKIEAIGRVFARAFSGEGGGAIIVGHAHFDPRLQPVLVQPFLRPDCRGDEPVLNDCLQFGLGIGLPDACYKQNKRLHVHLAIPEITENVFYYFHGDGLNWVEAHRFCLINGGIMAAGIKREEREAMAETLLSVRVESAWMGACCRRGRCRGVEIDPNDDTEFTKLDEYVMFNVIDGVNQAMTFRNDGDFQKTNASLELPFFCKIYSSSSSNKMVKLEKLSNDSKKLVLDSGCRVGFALQRDQLRDPWTPFCSAGKFVSKLREEATAFNRPNDNLPLFGIQKLTECSQDSGCFGGCYQWPNGTECRVRPPPDNCARSDWALHIDYEETSIQDKLTREFVASPLSWLAALDVCAKLGGQLANTGLEPSLSVLKATLSKAGSNASKIWTGTWRSEHRWINFGARNTFSPWAPGEPDGFSSINPAAIVAVSAQTVQRANERAEVARIEAIWAEDRAKEKEQLKSQFQQQLSRMKPTLDNSRSRFFSSSFGDYGSNYGGEPQESEYDRLASMAENTQIELDAALVKAADALRKAKSLAAEAKLAAMLAEEATNLSYASNFTTIVFGAAVLDVGSGLLADDERDTEFPFVCEKPKPTREFSVEVEGSEFRIDFGRRRLFSSEEKKEYNRGAMKLLGSTSVVTDYGAHGFCDKLPLSLGKDPVRTVGHLAVVNSKKKLIAIQDLVKEAADFLSHVGYDDDAKFWTDAHWSKGSARWNWANAPGPAAVPWQRFQPDGRTTDGRVMTERVDKMAVVNGKASFHASCGRANILRKGSMSTWTPLEHCVMTRRTKSSRRRS